MGYSTDFLGCFKCTPVLTEAQRLYLSAFAEKRHMKRRVASSQPIFSVKSMPDPLREAIGLPVGKQGAYFVGGRGFAGQEEDSTVVDHSTPPSICPSLWCHWAPSECGKYFGWNGNEKFAEYVSWLVFITDHFLGQWGVVLNGVVRWQGEDAKDWGSITVKDNVIHRMEKVAYTPTHPDKMAKPSTRLAIPARPIRSVRELKRR